MLEKFSGIQVPLLGIGVGVAGIVNPFEGVILQSNPLNVSDRIDFYSEIKSVVDVPVLIENDAKCCCWGELAFKRNERHRNFMFVLGEFRRGQTHHSDYWGPAIGIGIVINKKVYYGESFSAGEFQSTQWKDGNKSQLSLSNEEALRIKEDPKVRKRVIRELSSHAAFLVNTLNLTCIVFGGERAAYGAAAMFLERLFAMPEVGDTTEYSIPINLDAIYSTRARVL